MPYIATLLINTIKIPGKCLALLLPSPSGWPWNQRRLCLNAMRPMGCATTVFRDGHCSGVGRFWEERRDKLISMSNLSSLHECNRSFYNKVSFPGGDKHPFSCFFSCSNLEFSSYSQISKVFTTVAHSSYEIFCNFKQFTLLWNLNICRSRHNMHEAWYHCVMLSSR